jgi:hypothetical protein
MVSWLTDMDRNMIIIQLLNWKVYTKENLEKMKGEK